MKDEPLGVPGAHQKLARPIELMVLFGMLMVLLGQFINFQQNEDVQKAQIEGRERSYQTRAINCDLAKGIGVSEPVGCGTKEVTRYRDSRVVASSSASSRASADFKKLVCAILIGSEMPTVRQVYNESCD